MGARLLEALSLSVVDGRLMDVTSTPATHRSRFTAPRIRFFGCGCCKPVDRYSDHVIAKRRRGVGIRMDAPDGPMKFRTDSR